jgi:hypothetical protein
MTRTLRRIGPALALAFTLLLAPAAASAQQGGAQVPAAGAPTSLAARPASLSELSAGAALAHLPAPTNMVSSQKSLSRHLLVGSSIGAVAGAAFGLWVISMADCGGSNCTQQRVLGVAGLAAGGAAIGALGGGLVYLVRR